MKCPKCHSEKIRDPKYSAPSYGKEECLIYICDRCEFPIQKPCLDSILSESELTELGFLPLSSQEPQGEEISPRSEPSPQVGKISLSRKRKEV